MGKSLKSVFLSGTMWTAAENVIFTVLGIVQLAITSRILSSTDFGVYAIAVFFTGLGTIAFSMGLGPALVQKKGDIKDYLDTAWSYYLPSEPGTGTAKDLGYGEKLVRDALASWNGPRDEVLVATKTGYRRTMEVPAFVAPASDSGESDTQDVFYPVLVRFW